MMLSANPHDSRLFYSSRRAINGNENNAFTRLIDNMDELNINFGKPIDIIRRDPVYHHKELHSLQIIPLHCMSG